MENQPVQEPIEDTASNIKSDMEAVSEKIDNTIKIFDGILVSHIERLLETRFGIDELELNILTVSSIILIATRETEIDAFPHLPPPRYTEDSLLDELAEMSIEPDSNLISYIDGMEEKGYIKISDDGRFFSKKPTSSMAQLFEKIFPNMPGLNFVAYIGQMIDEVLANRKTQEEASRQFNQMLEMQGVPVSSASKQSKKKYPHLRIEDTGPEDKETEQNTRILPGKPESIFSQLKTNNIISSSSKTRGAVRQEETDAEKNPPYTGEGNNAQAGMADQSQPVQHETGDLKEDSVTVLTKEDEKSEGIDNKNGTETGYTIKDSFDPLDDRDIEGKILEFEEQLGLKCPLCSNGGIKASETAKGKAYYHCTNDDCNFISWGKPYYFDCPKCNNHFLIEVADSNGKGILKCPKATCTHWQKFPWDEVQSVTSSVKASDSSGAPKKTVRKVRRRKRRVVRRKK